MIPANLNFSVAHRVLVFLLCGALLGIPVASVAQGQATDFAGTASAALPEQQTAQVVWIDVRSRTEYLLDHISGDLRIPYRDIVSGVESLYPDRQTPIRLYCASGGRAGTAMRDLKAAGYANVENAGGIEDVRVLRFAQPGLQTESE